MKPQKCCLGGPDLTWALGPLWSRVRWLQVVLHQLASLTMKQRENKRLSAIIIVWIFLSGNNCKYVYCLFFLNTNATFICRLFFSIICFNSKGKCVEYTTKGAGGKRRRRCQEEQKEQSTSWAGNVSCTSIPTRKALKPHTLLSIHKGLRKVVPCPKNHCCHNILRPPKMQKKKKAFIPQIGGRNAISGGNQVFWRTATSTSAHNSQVLLFAWF